MLEIKNKIIKIHTCKLFMIVIFFFAIKIYVLYNVLLNNICKTHKKNEKHIQLSTLFLYILSVKFKVLNIRQELLLKANVKCLVDFLD